MLPQAQQLLSFSIFSFYEEMGKVKKSLTSHKLSTNMNDYNKLSIHFSALINLQPQPNLGYI